MGNRIINLAALIAMGVVVANLVANPKGTATLINGITGLWQTSVNGLLAKPTNSSGQTATLA